MIKFIILIFLFLAPTVFCDWRENGNFYQIYPRSFKDSNGDGIGDLNGVAEKVQYLKDLGMDGVWLSPIMKSPMADFGYDISDYYDIHHEYGTMADFDNLLKKCNEVGIKLILDFVPNHTSDESEWFKKSERRESGYEDYYIWHSGKVLANGTRVPPNNWVSVFRFPAWKWSDIRQQYYLHQFADKQPDLNYREPKVVEEMKNVLRFWLKKGVSGFRIDAVPFLFEYIDGNGEYPDEPVSGKCDDPLSHCYLDHIFTQDRPETFEMAYQWREVVDEFPDKVLMIEALTSTENILKLYGDGRGRNGAQIPFNFELLFKTTKTSTAKDIHKVIEDWNMVKPENRSSNWVLGNHDVKRIGTRIGRPDLFNILLQTLPGNAVTYNGEEIAMVDGYVSWEDTVDPQGCNTNSSVYVQYSRDGARTPMQWDNTKNAGFSTASKTWLPVSSNYPTLNVKAQEEAAASSLKLFKELVKLKKTAVFQNGKYGPKLINNDILAYNRTHNGEAVFVVLNFGESSYAIDMINHFGKSVSQVQILATNVWSVTVGSKVNGSPMFIPAESGYVFKASSGVKQVLSFLSLFVVVLIQILF